MVYRCIFVFCMAVIYYRCTSMLNIWLNVHHILSFLKAYHYVCPLLHNIESKVKPC